MRPFVLAAGLFLAAHPHTEAHYFKGKWSCHQKGRAAFALAFTPVKVIQPRNKNNIPSQRYDVVASGAAAKRLPATAALLVTDRGNTFVNLSGTGVCGAPAPLQDDDAPGAGSLLCSHFEASAPGWDNDVLALDVNGTTTSGKQYALELLLTRANGKRFVFSLRDGDRVLAEGECHR